MKVFLGADHRGFSLKEDIKSYLLSKGYAVADMGAYQLDLDDDYPDFAYAVAQRVVENSKDDRGILICGSGMGMDVVANKIKGIRATVAYSKESAAHARTNDDINVISLAGDILYFGEAAEIVKVFLETLFIGEERHRRRIEKIKKIEDLNFR